MQLFVPYLESSKVNDAVNVWMRLEDFVKVLLFPDVGMEEIGSLSTDEFNSIDGFFRGVEKVVCDDHFVVCF